MAQTPQFRELDGENGPENILEDAAIPLHVLPPQGNISVSDAPPIPIWQLPVSSADSNSQPPSPTSNPNRTSISAENSVEQPSAETPSVRADTAAGIQPPLQVSAASQLTPSLKFITVCLVTITLFIFVALITWNRHLPNWPLASVSIPTGILLLTVVSKLTDWALAGATDEAWEKLQWGPLLHRSGNLLTFMLMGSGLGAWWKVLWSSPSKSASSWITIPRLPELSPGPRFWSFLR
jgi:hypothetical protein